MTFSLISKTKFEFCVGVREPDEEWLITLVFNGY